MVAARHTQEKWLVRTNQEERLPPWEPQPGPQTQALLSEADELLYGGAAGGGKTDLLLGAAGTQHYRSVIFRRVFPSIRGIIERSREIYNNEGQDHQRDSYNESLHIWRLSDGRIVEFSSLQHEQTKEDHRGRPRDFYGWDELTEFTESQFRFVNAWNRTTRPGQRTRIIATCNPPTTPEGEWVIRYWAPWLDPAHPNPAEPGELRWFASIAGEDIEVEDGRPFVYEGEEIQPRSRTFIPARLSDNRYLAEGNYRSVLQGLPEPLRSQMLYGDFTAGTIDNPWQVIPTQWVRDAQSRWQEDGATTRHMDALGVDVARGGKDKTVLSPRYGTWFAPLQKHPGQDTPDGPYVASLVAKALIEGRGERAQVNIDGIGVGASVYDHVKAQVRDRAQSVIFSEGARDAEGKKLTDKTGTLEFRNLRAFAYWHLRELLDPQGEDPIALPPDRDLLVDLTAPRWSMPPGGVLVESKEEIFKRLQRSTDAGDAVVLAAMPVLTPPPPPVPTFVAVTRERAGSPFGR